MLWRLKVIRSFVLQVEQAKTSIHCLLLMDGIRVALLTSTTLGTLTHMALRLADRTLSLRICLPALTLAVLLSFAFLTACNWKEADVSSSECEEEMSEMKANDIPQDHLPVLNSKALFELKGTPEGTSGGLMSHQWEVSGQVVACDEESGAVAVSVDSDNDYAQYLNSPILVSAGNEAGFAVGDGVVITFLPPGSEETVLHPSNLVKSR